MLNVEWSAKPMKNYSIKNEELIQHSTLHIQHCGSDATIQHSTFNTQNSKIVLQRTLSYDCHSRMSYLCIVKKTRQARVPNKSRRIPEAITNVSRSHDKRISSRKETPQGTTPSTTTNQYSQTLKKNKNLWQNPKRKKPSKLYYSSSSAFSPHSSPLSAYRAAGRRMWNVEW